LYHHIEETSSNSSMIRAAAKLSRASSLLSGACLLRHIASLHLPSASLFSTTVALGVVQTQDLPRPPNHPSYTPPPPPPPPPPGCPASRRRSPGAASFWATLYPASFKALTDGCEARASTRLLHQLMIPRRTHVAAPRWGCSAERGGAAGGAPRTGSRATGCSAL